MTEKTLTVIKFPEPEGAPFFDYDTAALVLNSAGWLYCRGVRGFDFWADSDICAWRVDPRASGRALNEIIDFAAAAGVGWLMFEGRADEHGGIISRVGEKIDALVNLDKSAWVVVPGDNRPLVSGVKAIHNDGLAPLFDMGRPVMSIGINEAIKEDPAFNPVVLDCLSRHIVGDWGNMPADDRAMNDAAVKSGDDRIFSGYDTEHGKIWIITEWDRSYSTVMFPSEY